MRRRAVEQSRDKLVCEAITEKVIGCAIDVHRVLGPGLLESAYKPCLAYELQHRGVKTRSRVTIPLNYKGVQLECGYRADVIVEDAVLLEIKSVETLLPIHEAQLLSYLRLTNLPVGLLINFNVKLLTKYIVRRANTLPLSAISAISAVKMDFTHDYPPRHLQNLQALYQRRVPAL